MDCALGIESKIFSLLKVTKFFSWKFFTFRIFFLYKFIYFIPFIFGLGLCCCAWAFSSCSKWELLFVAVHRLLIAVSSLVAEHGL